MTAAPFCNACGARFEGEDRFCANCGAGRPITGDQPQWGASSPLSPVVAMPSPAKPVPPAWEHPVIAESRAFWSTPAGRWIAVIVLALVVGAGVLGVVNRNGGGGEASHLLLGSVLIQQSENFSATGTSCVGRGRLADMQPGATVTIRDGDGDVIATDTLEQGAVTLEGNCRLRYGVEVLEAGEYVFVIGQQPPTRPASRAMLESAATSARMTDGDWWITHGYD